jgi:microcystin degradation protein MlrC
MIKKRIALLGIYHETNTFAPEITDLGAFQNGFWLEQEQILTEYRGGNHEISGMAEVIEHTSGLSLVPVFYAYATPGGMVTKDALDAMLSRMFTLLEASGPFDGILVAPHGAGVSEEHPDMDGYWLHELRLRCQCEPAHGRRNHRIVSVSDQPSPGSGGGGQKGRQIAGFDPFG